MLFRLTTAQENRLEQQFELGKDGYSHPQLFNILLEKVMTDALEEHNGKVSIGGIKYYQSAICR